MPALQACRVSEFEADQVLNQIALLTVGEPQIHAFVVVVDDRVQIREASVVIEPAFQVSRERANRRRAVAHIRATISLEAVNANIGWRVQVPSWFSPEWLHMAIVASGFTAEEFVATSGRGFVEMHCGIRRGQ